MSTSTESPSPGQNEPEKPEKFENKESDAVDESGANTTTNAGPSTSSSSGLSHSIFKAVLPMVSTPHPPPRNRPGGDGLTCDEKPAAEVKPQSEPKPAPRRRNSVSGGEESDEKDPKRSSEITAMVLKHFHELEADLLETIKAKEESAKEIESEIDALRRIIEEKRGVHSNLMTQIEQFHDELRKLKKATEKMIAEADPKSTPSPSRAKALISWLSNKASSTSSGSNRYDTLKKRKNASGSLIKCARSNTTRS